MTAAREMIESYHQRYKKSNTTRVIVVQRGLVAKIQNFCYNLFKEMREKIKIPS